MIEQWRVVYDYPDYEISDSGRIRRLTRGGRRYPIGYELKAKVHPRGYLWVALTRDEVMKHKLIHRLVLLSFVGPPPTPRHEAAHADGSRTNNKLDNLRWATPAENTNDKKRHGTVARGKALPQTKLEPHEVDAIRKRYAAGGRRYVGGAITMQALADEYGVGLVQISRIVNGHRWQTQTG